jgi:hypothetical protein
VALSFQRQPTHALRFAVRRPAAHWKMAASRNDPNAQFTQNALYIADEVALALAPGVKRSLMRKAAPKRKRKIARKAPKQDCTTRALASIPRSESPRKPRGTERPQVGVPSAPQPKQRTTDCPPPLEGCVDPKSSSYGSAHLPSPTHTFHIQTHASPRLERIP